MSNKLNVGTILVPKENQKHRFKKDLQYIVTQKDIDNNPKIGEYWEISNTNKVMGKQTLTNQEILEKVKTIVANKIGLDVEEIGTEDSFDDTVYLDSLDKIEVVMECEKEFNLSIEDDAVQDCKNCKELVEAIEKLL